jgi:phosphatidylglycerophosphate synthase
MNDDDLAHAASLESGLAYAAGDAPPQAAPIGFVLAISQGDDGPVAALSSGGLAIIRRQIRQLHDLGVTSVVLAVRGPQDAAIDGARREAARNGMALAVVDSADQLAAALAGQSVFAIDEGLLVDERMLAAFFGRDQAARRGNRPVLATRGPDGREPAGLARLPALALDEGMAVAMLETGLAALVDHQPHHADLSGLDTYAPNRRRHVPMVWLRLRDRRDAARGTTLLLESAQKGCLDWPARFIHPPIENLLTRLALPTPITPNMVSVFVFVIGLYAAWSFAVGSWGLALAIALVIGPLDGLDGKLARTRLEFSRWGDLEHVGDKIVEYLCYICMAGWIGTGWAWAVCSLIVLFALAEAVQGEFFRRFSGSQLDDAGSVERRFRLVSGRRNTFMWCLIPFVLLDAHEAGFVMIAAYSVATFFFMQWRFYVRIAEVGQASSSLIADNMRRTAYAFLKKAD